MCSCVIPQGSKDLLKFEYYLAEEALTLRILNNENESAGEYFIISSCRSTLNYACGMQKRQVLWEQLLLESRTLPSLQGHYC